MDGRKKFFSEDEKTMLWELVFSNISVIENKMCDLVSLVNKKKCWEQIADDFNAVESHTKRTPQQLKKLWENTKSKRKAELAEPKRERIKTEGQVGDDRVALDTSEGSMLIDNVLLPKQHCDLPNDGETPESFPEIIVGHIEEVKYPPSTSGFSRTLKGETKKIKTDVESEEVIRIKHAEQFSRQNAELHALRVQEEELKIAMLKEEKNIQLLKMSMMKEEREEQHELFQIRKKNLLIEREMLKKTGDN